MIHFFDGKEYSPNIQRLWKPRDHGSFDRDRNEANPLSAMMRRIDEGEGEGEAIPFFPRFIFAPEATLHPRRTGRKASSAPQPTGGGGGGGFLRGTNNELFSFFSLPSLV